MNFSLAKKKKNNMNSFFSQWGHIPHQGPFPLCMVPTLIARLSTSYGSDDFSFKYHLPYEDLDALVSIPNDEDLDHMMLEHDHLCNTSTWPMRMRLFLFQTPVNFRGSFRSEDSRPDLELLSFEFGFGLEKVKKPPAVTNKTEFLFSLEKLELGVTRR